MSFIQTFFPNSKFVGRAYLQPKKVRLVVADAVTDDEAATLKQLNDVDATIFNRSQMVAGGVIDAYSLLMLENEKVVHFDPTDENNCHKVIGFATTSAVLNQVIDVIVDGEIEIAGLTPSAVYFAGVNGTISVTPIVTGIDLSVGIAKSASVLMIKFSEPTILI